MEVQKCFLCGKEKKFISYFKLYNCLFNKPLYEEKIPICPECRGKPINEIYRKIIETF